MLNPSKLNPSKLNPRNAVTRILTGKSPLGTVDKRAACEAPPGF